MQGLWTYFAGNAQQVFSGWPYARIRVWSVHENGERNRAGRVWFAGFCVKLAFRVTLPVFCFL